MRSRYKIFETHYPYFITATVVNWIPVFTNHEAFKIVINSLAFLRQKEGLRIYAYVIMENHLHAILQAEDLPNLLRRFKSFTARSIIDLLKQNKRPDVLEKLEQAKNDAKTDQSYQLWQDGSYPKQISDREMLMQKMAYIHNNPLKRGYVEKPEDWIYSSARNYLKGDESVLALDPIDEK